MRRSLLAGWCGGLVGRVRWWARLVWWPGGSGAVVGPVGVVTWWVGRAWRGRVKCWTRPGGGLGGPGGVQSPGDGRFAGFAIAWAAHFSSVGRDFSLVARTSP
jgi:hypothetical protein